MKSNILKRIDDFAKRHLLLSSFVCLIILSILINFYWAFDNRLLYHTGIEGFVDMVVSSILVTFFVGSIPIFFISLLLYSFLKKKSSVYTGLTFYQRFILSLIPAFVIILLFFVCIVSCSYELSDCDPWGVFFYTIYSIIFAAFFIFLTVCMGQLVQFLNH